MVVLTDRRGGNPATTAGISAVNLQTGVSTPVETGSFAAGDPRRPGVFVTVASSSPVNLGNDNTATPDMALELVDSDHTPVVLASAPALAGHLGWAPSTPISLLPVPGPTGALVAVEVENLLEASSGTAICALSPS